MYAIKAAGGGGGCEGGGGGGGERWWWRCILPRWLTRLTAMK